MTIGKRQPDQLSQRDHRQAAAPRRLPSAGRSGPERGWRRAAQRALFRLALLAGMVLAGLAGLVFGLGLLVEGFQPPLELSDAIVVISGDDDNARLRAGLRLWREQWAPRLIFSGAAREGPISNAAAMQRLAVAAGVPASAILLEERGSDTYGNAVQTRQLMEAHGLRSAILVTSPYHLQRASITFQGVFRGSEMRVIASAALDSDWRKLSWWQRPDLRQLTLREAEKLAYIGLTGRYN